MTDDLHPRLQDFVTEAATEANMPADQFRQAVERQIGIDLADVEDDDAERFVDAIESNEIDEAVQVLDEYGATDEDKQMFRQVFESTTADGQADVAGNGDSPPDSSGSSDSDGGGDDGLTPAQRQEIQQMIPTADDIAGELRSQMTGGGGGGGGGGGQSGGEGMSQQQQMALQIASNFLGSGGGGGQMAELGQEVQKAAMQSFIQEMRKPSFGDMVEAKLYEDMAPEYAEQFKESYMDDETKEVFGVDDDDDDSAEDDSDPLGVMNNE